MQADHYFAQNAYELAATYYARTKKSFEEVCLKFMTINERDALKTYLVRPSAQLYSPVAVLPCAYTYSVPVPVRPPAATIAFVVVVVLEGIFFFSFFLLKVCRATSWST